MKNLFIAPAVMIALSFGANAAEPPPMSDTCWNLRVGSVEMGEVYVLGVLSQRYPAIAEDVHPVLKSMTLTAAQRDVICKKIESAAIAQS